MNIINTKPGSSEWLQSFSASKAAQMLGLSKLPRSALLHAMHVGFAKEVSGYVQEKIFDRGHEIEAKARPLAAAILGEEIYPVAGEKDFGLSQPLTMSADGLTVSWSRAWENKQSNIELLESVRAGILPDEHQPQCQQIMMVSGAESTLFTVSNEDEILAHLTVLPSQEWRDRIIQGWAQFAKDLGNYIPPEVIPEVIAAPIKDLPAITYKMNGMSLSTNLRNDVKPAILALVEQSKRKLETDQDFADLDALCKKFKKAEEQCALVQSQAVGEIKDVDAFCRELKELAEIMRQARIAGEKAVSSEKDARKLAILSKAKAELTNYIIALNLEIKPIVFAIAWPDFAGAIKGMKNLSAMQEATDTMLRDGKMLADLAAKDVRAKLAWLKIAYIGYELLFRDLQNLTSMPLEDFQLAGNARINAHKKIEAGKLEAQRVQMQAEANAKAKAAQDAILAAERAKMEAEVRAKAEEEAKAREVAEKSVLSSKEDADKKANAFLDDLENKTMAQQEAGDQRAKPQVSQSERATVAFEPDQLRKEDFVSNSRVERPRPPVKELILVLTAQYDCSHGTACDWILSAAKEISESP